MLRQTVAEPPWRAAGNVRHFPFSGKVQVQNGSQEAVTMHVYIKSVVSGGRASFRGFMFAESVERDWFSYLDGYVCQPDVAHADWPSIFVRCPFPEAMPDVTTLIGPNTRGSPVQYKLTSVAPR